MDNHGKEYLVMVDDKNPSPVHSDNSKVSTALAVVYLGIVVDRDSSAVNGNNSGGRTVYTNAI